MLRLMLIPIVLLISTIVLIVLAYFLIKRMKKGFKQTVQKGKELANEQTNKWQQKQKDKEDNEKLPEIIKKALLQFKIIKRDFIDLSSDWKTELAPVIKQAKIILDEVSVEAIIEYETPSKKNHYNERVNSIRPFFIHSLDALSQLINKLNSDQLLMDDQETEKAHQTIETFKADFEHHQKILEKSRKMDFDVVMDVIKARLRK